MVGQRPVAVEVVEVAAAVLEKYAQGFRRGLRRADEAGVAVAALDVGEAADMADDFAKRIGPFPRDREGGDAAGTVAADRTAGGIGGDVQSLQRLR